MGANVVKIGRAYVCVFQVVAVCVGVPWCLFRWSRCPAPFDARGPPKAPLSPVVTLPRFVPRSSCVFSSTLSICSFGIPFPFVSTMFKLCLCVCPQRPFCSTFVVRPGRDECKQLTTKLLGTSALPSSALSTSSRAHPCRCGHCCLHRSVAASARRERVPLPLSTLTAKAQTRVHHKWLGG